MSDIAYIGIDDTDVIDSIGTGRVARGLAACLEEQGLGEPLGVTRHQLLLDRRIPYTSHNSSLCVAFRMACKTVDLRQPCINYLASIFQDGSDPGLCICRKEQIGDKVIEWGRAAQKSILKKAAAVSLALEYDIFLVELGGTGGGIIGALAAVALRADGNSGRFVDLKGIRGITGTILAGDLKACTNILAVHDQWGMPLPDNEFIDSRDWVRPSLVGGKPVLRVKPSAESPDKRIWVSIETRHKNEQEVR